MPAVWRANRPPRPQVTATMGGKPVSGLGADALLDFRLEVTLDGEKLTATEIKELLARSDGLVMVRGRWVEIDAEGLKRTLDHFQQVERAAVEHGLSFGEAMRMLAGADTFVDGSADESGRDWAQVIAGPWLAEMLQGLRSPEGLARVEPGVALYGSLRPYQQVGLRWPLLPHAARPWSLPGGRHGLGKTIQVLSLLLVLKNQAKGEMRPSLLVAPASSLANWTAEIERFAPGLKAHVACDLSTTGQRAGEIRNTDFGR